MRVSSRSLRLIVLALLMSSCACLATASGASGARKSKLSLRAIELTPGSVQAGGSITVLGELVSRGRKAGSRDLKVLLVGPSGGETISLSGPRVSVRARSRRGFAFSVALPDRLAEGPYSLIVCAPRRGATAGGPCSRAGRNLTVVPHPSGPSPGPVPGPGPRSLGDPLFPEVGNGGYDVKHYDVDIDWTLPDNFQSGTKTTITAQATQALSDFSLDFEGLTVDAVKVDGVAASFSREVPAACSEAPDPCPPTKLVITPATPIDDGATFTVEVDYTGNPQRHTDPDGSDEGWIDTTDGAFVVNEPIGAMTWMPCNNHPKDRATYDTTITVPVGRTGVGNGELVSHTDDLTKSTWHWKSDATLPTYLSTASIGNFYLDQQTTSTGLPIYNFIDSTAIATGLTSLMPEKGIFDFFSVLYGPYPFDSAGAVIDDAPDVGYALEVQTKPHFGLPVVDAVTLAHEYSHQWFGDNVTLTTWKDIWLNEGWATWSEQDWDYQENGGTSPADDFTSNYTPGTKWNTAPTDPTAAGLFSTFPTYTRPGMMLEALRQILGDAKFLQLARTWQSDHRQGNATTAQFIALAEQVSGFSGATLSRLDTFFQQWLYGTTMPTITGSNF